MCKVTSVLKNRDELVIHYEGLKSILDSLPNDEVHSTIREKWASGLIHVTKLKSETLSLREISKALDCMQEVLGKLQGFIHLVDAISI